ncbi:hypothetical protein [Neoroseomonas lacus]|uniref:Uncharacterized protein n=1 Tax=Neoroseomonas lacus TaxID=287609 RepID=A0A917KKG4_9PROT|nr:hypothetical protein [Neoroseomonas lacus]GGJ16347.1 hypothetical protein GCM10011320_24580 [Neoroseomonas lacus]
MAETDSTKAVARDGRRRLPRMSRDEIALLRDVVRVSRRVSEFGIGGSTALFLRSGVEKLVSVETDQAWIELMRSDPDVLAALEAGRLHLQHVDLGPVKPWGYPATREKFDQWCTYARAPWPLWESLQCDPDLVLVDGRFRVACAARAAEFFMRKSRGGGARILVHDIVAERVGYQKLFNFLEPIQSAGSLFLFQCKSGIGVSEVAAIAEGEEANPA